MRLRRPILVVCAAALVAAGGSGCGSTSGKDVFASAGCGNCHTLADAGATAQNGPNLDIAKPSAQQVAATVAQGGGAMPSFSGQLSSDEIQAVADYVEQATHQ